MRDLRSRLLPVLRLVAAGALVAIAVAGCASATNAEWTFAPEPAATPVPSVSATAAPSEAPPATAAPSGTAAPSSGAGGGTTITIKALNIAFDPTAVDAPAGQAFTIDFDNQDAGIPHNIQILDASGASVFKGDIFNGVETRAYSVPALAAGSYKFQCDVHPNMTGTLTVK